MFSSEGKYRKTYRHQFDQLRDNENELPLSIIASRAVSRNIPLNEMQLNALSKSNDEYVDVDGFQQIITSKMAQKSLMKRMLYDIADPVMSKSQKVEVHSYIDAYSWCPPPLFILLITIAQVATFLVYFETETPSPFSRKRSIWTDCAGCYIHENHSLQPGILIFAPKLREEAWRFFSYQFLHAGLNHLLGNCIMQLLVGLPLEVAHKSWRIAPLYLLAVGSGALLQYAIDTKSLLVGASAGVYALIFAHIANVILNWHEMPFRWARVIVLGTFVSYDFGAAIWRRFYEEECDQISHSAHISGAITGLLFGYCILYNVVEHKIETIVRYLCIFLYSLFLVITITLVILRAPHSEPLWSSKCS
ncbi:unnamed protein product [Caenorhabditis angaria]|uniref:rhomboid protease n=1 Tax=Caenorhabditis angaria TaxID=860376 RepID=A0A9P1IKE0_9PELO|nr:unnamed protein product [Caenorhabditis angaria]